MFSYKKSRMHFLRWLRRLIFLWVKSQVFPKKTKQNIPLDKEKSVCYVLKQHSLLDLLILDHHCLQEGLPRPLSSLDSLSESLSSSFVYMTKQAVIDSSLSFKDYKELRKLFAMEENGTTKIQVVPVSTFWGRDPGRGEKSLLRLLFSDEERTGFFSRLFTFFAHGRNVSCCFGQAIPLEKLLEQEPKSLDDKAKNLHASLKKHFYEKQIAVLGPSIYNRNQVMRRVLESESVKAAIQKEVELKKIKKHKAKKRALGYINEIAAKVSPSILRFLEITLKWAFRRLYQRVHIYNFEKVRELAEQHEIVYLPCHRSHMDYLLINYHLLSLGVTVPHTAAGLNMNFWPMGPLFRGGGGFFLRRSFNGNALYKAVFEEYLNYLMKNRHSLCFYLEGGRSRTGQFLDPKMGLLSMISQHAYKSKRKVYLVPINISYDKMLDGFSYIKELRGYKKKSESFGQLFKARKVLKKKAGKAYMNFGEPIELGKELTNSDNFKEETKRIGHKVMEHIGDAGVVSPISIFSLALLSSPNRSLPEEDLMSYAETLRQLLRKVPHSKSLVIFEENIKQGLKSAENLDALSRFNHPAGDVIYIEEKKAELLSYYKNTVLPFFILPSIVASSFEAYQEQEKDELLKTCVCLYHFLKKEFFLKWTEDEIHSLFKKHIVAMTELGLLVEGEDKTTLRRPEVLTSENSYLLLLANVIGPTLRQYCLFSSLLEKISEEDGNPLLKSYEQECSLLAQKLTILGLLPQKSVFNEKWFQKFLKLLTENGFIKTEGKKILTLEKLADFSQEALRYLGPSLSSSLRKTKRNTLNLLNKSD